MYQIKQRSSRVSWNFLGAADKELGKDSEIYGIWTGLTDTDWAPLPTEH